MLNAYAVTLAAPLIPAGLLGDRIGHRRVLLIAVFTIAPLVCAVAPSVLGAGGGACRAGGRSRRAAADRWPATCTATSSGGAVGAVFAVGAAIAGLGVGRNTARAMADRPALPLAQESARRPASVERDPGDVGGRSSMIREPPRR